tara:strand:- start:10035 stop:12788 length:2754 start_codon:yes stop_codon:yes gene_type:complete
MELYQNKLTRAEWETIEKPVSEEEKKILKLISDGYYDTNVRKNDTSTFLSYTKVAKTPEVDWFIFKQYFQNTITECINKYGKGTTLENLSDMKFLEGKDLKQLKGSDSIRINNSDSIIRDNKQKIFEYILIELFEKLLKNLYKKNTDYAFYLYTLLQLKKSAVHDINKFVNKYIDAAIAYAQTMTKVDNIMLNAYDFIEKNKYLMKYADKELYSHQRKVFDFYRGRYENINIAENKNKEDIHTLCKEKKQIQQQNLQWIENDMYLGDDEEEKQKQDEEYNRKIQNQLELDEDQETQISEIDDKLNELYTNQYEKSPSLVIYTAPTGTGKTLTPIGLAGHHRIIFVCVARHIGMALAKSAISVNRKIAFAFGCDTASDIRLHYYSAIDYTVNRKSGGIGKVDHSNGKKVEIMICDVQSYLTAMYYMMSFNEKEDIITYWDEPTITMDYEKHELHDIIHNNWKENKIPSILLSCATLPSMTELQPVFTDFKRNFPDAVIRNITSYDCKKSIPILDKDAYCALPHYLYENFDELMRCVMHCNENKTLLRYFDLREVVAFIVYVSDNNYIDGSLTILQYYKNISDITMNSIKEHYLEILTNLSEDSWKHIYDHLTSIKQRRIGDVSINRTQKNTETAINRNTGGLLATTSDAYSLTDGPSIFLTNNIDKIGQFYIQQSKIDPSVFEKIMLKIEYNEKLSKEIEKNESIIYHEEEKRDKAVQGDDKKKASSNVGKLSIESQKLVEDINRARKKIKLISMDPMYLPNTKSHQEIWAPDGEIVSNAFVSDIGEHNAKEIMQLNIDNNYKILMLLGIGTFKLHNNDRYMEIMKKLADEQRLYMIIASTDYIYGTNYQFCHGFISKDLSAITQQKTMQAMGRIGRNNIQQDYTIRFRDNDMIKALFTKPTYNLEAINMQKLFSSND